MFSKLNYPAQQRILTVAFTIVPLTLLFTFTFLPMFNMFYYSFLKWNGFSKTKEFIGLANYVRIFSDPEYFSVFGVSLYYLIGAILQLGLALYFATMLTFKVRGKNFFKGVLFFPVLMNGVAIGFIFLFFFKPGYVLDTLLSALGLDSWIRFWLRNPDIINISLAGTSIWRYMGWNFVIFLGAIQSISGDIYDAASIDGANRFQQFRYIIWPSILPIIELNLILAVKGAISVFEIPYIMTKGANGSMTFVIKTVETAFKFNKVGLASSMAVILLAIVIATTLLQRLFVKGDDA